jgi:hypothetical protein
MESLIYFHPAFTIVGHAGCADAFAQPVCAAEAEISINIYVDAGAGYA